MYDYVLQYGIVNKNEKEFLTKLDSITKINRGIHYYGRQN